MFFNNFSKIALIIACASTITTSNAVTINTPLGQYAYAHGHSACSVIDLVAAAQLLDLPSTNWRNLTPTDLAHFIGTGVVRYVDIVEAQQLPHPYLFRAEELVPHFSELQHMQTLNVVPTTPSPEDLAALTAAKQRIITIDQLAEHISNSSQLIYDYNGIQLFSDSPSLGVPVCCVWTARGSSQLICYHNGTWLFLDSHMQSDDTPGASIRIFTNTAAFSYFLRSHAIFQLKKDEQANATIFKFNSITPAAPPLSEGHERLNPFSILDHDDDDEMAPVTRSCSAAQTASPSETSHTYGPTHAHPKRHHCPFHDCDFAAKRRKDLVIHLRTHTGERPFKCRYKGCRYTAANRSALAVHTRIHTGERPFKCTYPGCGYAAICSSHLKNHEYTHTGELPFLCPHPGCSYATSTSVHLTRHMRTHTGVKPFKCIYEGCTYTATTSEAVTAHMRTHTGERPFKCTYEGCTYAATTSGAVTAHMRTHTGERPFKCTYEGCAYAATTSGAVAVHMRTHTKERPFKCTYECCDYAAATRAHLKQHMRKHTGEKPFKCKFPCCPYTTAQQSNLKRHMGIWHKKPD